MEVNHFFIVGAQRSGTTYLYHLCAEHPEIEMAQPIKPEPKYFLSSDRTLRASHYREQYFQNTDIKVLGEKSTSYIEVETAAERISSLFPSAKIIFLLRNPIARAISNYWFSVDNGLETLAIERAFREEAQRITSYDKGEISVSPYAYLQRGRYIDYINMYEKYFPGNQVHVLLYENLVSTSKTTLRDFYSFLGVENSYLPNSLNKKINSSSHNNNKNLPSGLIEYMNDYFREPNAQLSEKLRLPLSEWQEGGNLC